MKAKAYLAQFKKDEADLGTEAAMKIIYNAMLAEILQIIKDRHCKYRSAVESVLNEMNDRWNAMTRMEPGFQGDHFRSDWFRDLEGRGLFSVTPPKKDEGEDGGPL